MAEETRPDGLETKDTRGTLLGYIPAELPHVSRTGAELSDKERDVSLLSAGTPHAGAFDDTVAPVVLGEKSDSEHARRVGEGHYPAEGPAAAQASAPAPRNDQPDTATPKASRRSSGS